MGIPAISTLGVIVSFAIPQLYGWGMAYSPDSTSQRNTYSSGFVLISPFCSTGLNGVTMFMIGKGSMRAVRLHLTLAVISLVLTAAVFFPLLKMLLFTLHNRAWRKLLKPDAC
jgi:hypothetical protein